MYVYREQPKMRIIFVVGRQLSALSVRQSQTQQSHVQSKGQSLCGLEVDHPAFEPGPDMEICSVRGRISKCRWTPPLSRQLSPYGSSLGCSLETPYGIQPFPHNPMKTVLQSHIMNISFFFTNQLPRCGTFLFFLFFSLLSGSLV